MLIKISRICQTQAPETPRELFNLRHSKLRNSAERAFAILKKRFLILTTPPQYSIKKQGWIVLACCILHNYIRKWNWNDPYFEEYMKEEEDLNNPSDTHSDSDDEELGQGPTNEDKEYMFNVRDGLVQQMWNARAIR